MSYSVELTDLAVEELRAIRAFDRRRIVEAIREQLSHEPTVATRHRKCLVTVVPDFEHEPPIWELRIGDFRAFYDVDEDARVVFVRAVRRKEHGRTTGEIIDERDDP